MGQRFYCIITKILQQNQKSNWVLFSKMHQFWLYDFCRSNNDNNVQICFEVITSQLAKESDNSISQTLSLFSSIYFYVDVELKGIITA